MLVQGLARPSSLFSPLVPPYRIGLDAQRPFAKRLQLLSNGKSKKQQIQELLEENVDLKKEVETLKAEVVKKPNKFMGMMQPYGLRFLVWRTLLYLASGVSIYVALDTGLVSGTSTMDFIMQIGLDKFIDPTQPTATSPSR